MNLIFFRNRNSREHRDWEETVLDFLEKRFRGTIYVFSHIYDLPEDAPEWEVLRALEGPLTVFSWLSERAALWLLRKSNIEKEITCFDLVSLREETPLRIHGFHELENDTLAKRQIVNESRFENPPARRWYPIVDYAACIGCLECVNYCLFGVYEIGNQDKPNVVQPDQCRDGCPACSRVCPGGAIMFPEYDDPAISGRKPHTQPAWDDELDQLIDDVG